MRIAPHLTGGVGNARRSAIRAGMQEQPRRLDAMGGNHVVAPARDASAQVGSAELDPLDAVACIDRHESGRG